MVVDPHEHKKTYLKWKKNGSKLEGLNASNSKLILNYLDDMEIGKNISVRSQKGSRSYGRLRSQKSKLYSLFLIIQDNVKQDVTQLTDSDLLHLFKDLREGKIVSRWSGKEYRSPGAFVKALKSFWHWYQKVNRLKGIEVQDITVDLDSKDAKPKFNYFTFNDLNKMCNYAKFDYKVLMMLLFDSGIRSPTELMNVRVSDLEWVEDRNIYNLTIQEATSKTFGRKIKLLLSSQVLKEYIETKELKDSDYIFTKSSKVMNEYLGRIGLKVLNIGKKSEGTSWISEALTLYDFRHSAACFWLGKYKQESALKYRFGWKKTEMIFYYSEFLGLNDSIQEEDLYTDVGKTELEKKIVQLERDNEIKEQASNKQMEEINAKSEELAKTVSMIVKVMGDEKLRKEFEKFKAKI